MMEIIPITNNESGLWSDYIRTRSEPLFCHDYRWRYVMEESFKRRSYYLMATRDGKPQGILPLFLTESQLFGRSLISMPFLNYGGLVADNAEAASLLFKEAMIIAEREKVSYVEMRHFYRSDLSLVTRDHKVTFILDLLSNSDEQWKILDPKVRNQIRKAEKCGLSVREGKDELLGQFYSVFCRNMRDLGTPVLGKVFFDIMLKYFLDETRIFIVEYRQRPIAGAFTLTHNKVLEIPWASSIHSFNMMCPSMALYWKVVQHAIAAGCDRFDFGRCSKDSGTYRFKKQWGAKVQQLYWQYGAPNGSNIPSASTNSCCLGLAVKIWQHLPLWVTNRIGPWVARTLPTF